MYEDTNIRFLCLMQRSVWGEDGQAIDVAIVANAEVDIISIAF